MTDDEIRQNIKNNLIDLRKRKGLTQTEIAEIVGKKAPSVASWEQGISLPDLQTLYRLSIYYNKMMEYFYENNPKENEDDSSIH